LKKVANTTLKIIKTEKISYKTVSFLYPESITSAALILQSSGRNIWNTVQCSIDITNTQFARHSQWGTFCRFHWTLKSLKAFSFRGASPPDPLTRGSAPGPRWGLRPQTPVGWGSVAEGAVDWPPGSVRVRATG